MLDLPVPLPESPLLETPPSLQLGPLNLALPIISAPIAGFTDFVFREILREFGGAGLIYTEMVSAGGWIHGEEEQPRRLSGVAAEPGPLGVQLWDREPANVEEGARRLRGEYGVSVIDLNFGCPKERVMGRQGAGASLLRDPSTIFDMVEATVRGAGGREAEATPVTAKIRLGESTQNQTACAVAKAAQEAGAVAVTVHGRCADQSYAVPCDYAAIAEVVAAVEIPVIANGDIACAKSAVVALQQSGAAGVMVGRAALRHPWVFREIAAVLRGEDPPTAPTLSEQRDQLIRHHHNMVEKEGDPSGTIRMRKFAGRYLAGVPGAREFRSRIGRAKDSAQFLAVVDGFFPIEEGGSA